MFQEEHRIRIGDGGQEQPLGVVRSRRHGDLDPRDMHHERLQALGMLRALSPTAPDDGPHDEGYAHLPAEHRPPLGRQVEQLIHGQIEKVAANMDVHRPQAAECGADGHAGHPAFRDRRVEDPLRPEPLDQVLGAAEDRLVIVDPDPHHDDAGILFHGLRQSLVQRIAVGYQPHRRSRLLLMDRSSLVAREASFVSRWRDGREMRERRDK